MAPVPGPPEAKESTPTGRPTSRSGLYGWYWRDSRYLKDAAVVLKPQRLFS